MSAVRSDYNVALNGYRGLCALLVFMFHVGSAGVVAWPSGDAVSEAATFAWMSLTYGVEMFFMISGYVILGSLLRHATIGAFLRDRFIRIFCAWVPALLAVTAVCAALKMKVFADASPVEALAVFTANLALLPPVIPIPMIHLVSWSLTYEWVFYLAAAAGALVLRRAFSRRWAVALWALAAALFICLFPRALFFLVGVIVFTQRDWFVRRAAWLRAPLLSLVVFLLAWRFTGAYKAHLNDTLFDWLLDGRWIAALIAFAAALHMFAAVCLETSRQSAFLRTHAFQFLGTISYSFYLWHSLVMSATKRALARFATPDDSAFLQLTAFAIVSFFIALPVSWLSWKLFEIGLARMARRALQPREMIGEAVRAA